MAGEPEGRKPETVTLSAASAVIVSFSAEEPTVPTVTLKRCTLGQVMAAAWFLDEYARELRQGQLAEQQLGSIIPPSALENVLAAIGKQNGGRTS